MIDLLEIATGVLLCVGGLVISYKWSMYVFSKGGKHEGSGDGTLGISRRR